MKVDWAKTSWNEDPKEMPTFKVHVLIGLMERVLFGGEELDERGRLFLRDALNTLHGELKWRIENGVT